MWSTGPPGHLSQSLWRDLLIGPFYDPHGTTEGSLVPLVMEEGDVATSDPQFDPCVPAAA